MFLHVKGRRRVHHSSCTVLCHIYLLCTDEVLSGQRLLSVPVVLVFLLLSLVSHRPPGDQCICLYAICGLSVIIAVSTLWSLSPHCCVHSVVSESSLLCPLSGLSVLIVVSTLWSLSPHCCVHSVVSESSFMCPLCGL